MAALKLAIRLLLLIALIGAGVFYYSREKGGYDPIKIRLPGAGVLPRGGVEKPRTDDPVAPYTPYFLKNTQTINERVYTYYTYGPRGAVQAGTLYPLVLVLHGAPGNAYAAVHLAMPETAAKYPAFVMAPVLEAGNFWALPDGYRTGITAAVEIIKNFASHHPVDMNRIYVVGCSDGGTGVYGAAQHFGVFFAAAMPLSGFWDARHAGDMTRLPIWAIHGIDDALIKIDSAQATMDAVRSAGGNAVFTAVPNLFHECNSPRMYTDAQWQWLFAQRKSQQPPAQNDGR